MQYQPGTPRGGQDKQIALGLEPEGEIDCLEPQTENYEAFIFYNYIVDILTLIFLNSS